MRSRMLSLALGAIFLAATLPAPALKPVYRVTDRGVLLERVSPRNPMIYDNDWWKNVPDAAYLWAKASMGQADLRGNIVSRDMWG